MNRVKTFAALVAALVIAVAVLGCAGGPRTPVAYEPGEEYSLTVLHTNDHHGSVLSKDDGKGVLRGGLAERGTFVKSVRADVESKGGSLLVLDAGDINTGSALSNIFSAQPDIAAYNLIGYDAATLGNHEFDKPLSTLRAQMKQATFPFVSANVKVGSRYLTGKPYLIKDFLDADGKGFRVAVIGLTTLRSIVTAKPDKSITFVDEIEAAREAVALVRDKEKADVVIILGHLGDVLEAPDQNTSIKLAEEVSGIDLIIDGHSHSFFSEPKIVNGTPIVTANEWGKYMGNGTLTVKDGKVSAFTWKPVEITAAAFSGDADIAAVIAPYKEKLDASFKDVVMVTAAEFPFNNREARYNGTALGAFAADATAWFIRNTFGQNLDFAFQNGGNIRASLPAGNVTREDILTVLPFENYNYVLTLKGSEVQELFDFIATVKQGAGGFPQMSKEVRYTLTIDAAGNGKISDLTIGGAPLDPKRTYKIATNDYIASGGDGYVVCKKSSDTFNTSMLLSDILVDYVRTFPKPISPSYDGRLTVTGPGVVQP